MREHTQVRNHTNVHTVTCCDMLFASSGNLTVHVRRKHTGDMREHTPERNLTIAIIVVSAVISWCSQVDKL